MASGRKVTLNDIAEACGVSRATVSLVLRESPLVHPETRQRVKDEMRRQGYVYNRAAAGLFALRHGLLPEEAFGG